MKLYSASWIIYENIKFQVNFVLQSNCVIRNFWVTLKLFLNAKCTLSLWSKKVNGCGKWFLNTNFSLSNRSLSPSLTVYTYTMQFINTLSILRLNGDQNGGAWCLASPVSCELDNNEWIQVDLGKMHLVTGVKTQGRLGNGRGAEYTKAYKLHYWRPGMTDFIEYHDSLGRKITTGKPSSLWQRQVKCARTLTHENCVFVVVFKSKQISR